MPAKYLGDPVPAPDFEAPEDPAARIKREGPLSFRTTGQRQDVALIPLNPIFAERYSVYWRMRRKA